MPERKHPLLVDVQKKTQERLQIGLPIMGEPPNEKMLNIQKFKRYYQLALHCPGERLGLCFLTPLGNRC